MGKLHLNELTHFRADGDPGQLSKSQLYFGDSQGNVWEVPYMRTKEAEKPVKRK